ncbi:MAG: hypothetical protein ACRDB0_01340 [Paraclostridium sp.]
MKELFIKELVEAIVYEKVDISYHKSINKLDVFHIVKNNKHYSIDMSNEEFEMLRFLIANAKRKKDEATNL